MHKHHKFSLKQPLLWLILSVMLLVIWLSACSSPPAEVVEVTRVVTETIIVEGESVEVEVTRVVTETVTETITETVEVEAGSDEDIVEEEPEPLEATGSEDDSGPLPPEPEDGPKVTSGGGTTDADEVAMVEGNLETAVPRRANPTRGSQLNEPILITFSNTENSDEWLKFCELISKIHKKQCV